MTNALLATYNTSMWPIARQDKRLTKAAVKLILTTPDDMGFNASSADTRKVGRFVKNRLDPNDRLWRAICTARDNARAIHYAYTLPWQEGLRLVNPVALEEYQERMADAENAFWQAVDAFVADAARLKDEAMQVLGTYYRESDYADLNRDAFDFSVTIQPMAHDAQFDAIADLIGAEKAQELAQELKDRQAKQWHGATRAVWHRVYDALKHASDKLNHGQRLHDSVMDNLQELTDLLPVLNVTNDAELEQARKELVALFKQYSTLSVKDKATRSSCAAQVDAILSKLPAAAKR